MGNSIKTNNSVAVVDYGMGNLHSVSQAVRVAAQDSAVSVQVTSDPAQVRAASRIVLPGQGAMPDCMQALRSSGLLESILEAAKSKPLFGICVGMQMLLDYSEEGASQGLGFFAGNVRKFELGQRLQADGSRFKVPQMGWNQVQQSHSHVLWENIPDQQYFYFVHSFFAQPLDARHSVGETDYGGIFTAAIARDNIFATQFHPEKSATSGLLLFRNFLRWKP